MAPYFAKKSALYTEDFRPSCFADFQFFWQPGEFVSINLLPDVDLASFLDEQRSAHLNQSLKNTLANAVAKASGGMPAAVGANS